MYLQWSGDSAEREQLKGKRERKKKRGKRKARERERKSELGGSSRHSKIEGARVQTYLSQNTPDSHLQRRFLQFGGDFNASCLSDTSIRLGNKKEKGKID